MVGPLATVSWAITPVGDWVVFWLAIAIEFVPACSLPVRSTTAACFHESVTRGEVLTATPLTHTSAVSSPVTTRVPPAGADASVNVLRKYLVMGGKPATGSPSGYQIHVDPFRPAAEVGCPMNDPCHSLAGARRPISNVCVAL